MDNKKRVKFICSGNVFRSVIAEYCLRDTLHKKGIDDVVVSSAGLFAMRGFVLDETIHALENHGIAWNNHRSRQYTAELASGYGLHVTMCKEMQRYVLEDFGKETPLFNEIAYRMRRSVKKSSVMDFVDYKVKDPDFTAIANATVQHILGGMDTFVERMPKYFPPK